MRRRCTDLRPEYFRTRFQVADPPPAWPREFAILSAFATTGSTWLAEHNEAADRRLEVELRGLGVWAHRVTGYAPDTGHAEPSWAVAVGFQEACDLGLRFLQDAIYFVQGDLLCLSHCDERRGLVDVGQFPERLDSMP